LSLNNGFGDPPGSSNLIHASNSSTANGNANQAIAYDQWVANIAAQPLGWVSVLIHL
jgi:hypothetical protein